MARQKAVSEDVEKLIKRFNQRLRQLEKDGLANQSKAYQYIMNKAMKNLASGTKVKQFAYTRSGEIKLRTDLATLKKQNKNVYKAVIKLATGFLDAKSSTKIGIEDSTKQSYEGFKNKTGFSGSFNEFSDLWNITEFVALTKRYGVSDSIEIIEDIVNGFGFSLKDAITEFYNSGASSVYGVYEYLEEKYGIKEGDFDNIK